MRAGAVFGACGESARRARAVEKRRHRRTRVDEWPDTARAPTAAAYATPTVAYAMEPGYQVQPIEANVRHEHGG
ncbi:hypothetical protein QMZ92_33885 [Streptomyces sp. HNM0645]|uniref:hypothetical protein n=1 Tax=Streptomyces sp. HNM0645 TaxID=2782343 RepID=UPI0024B73798|nr:hypothetical protein [Streptomyces sp. HNM0645]MDI9889193.1 hypothetical protein [Streptomyces sp. HNM0645]